MTLNNNHDLELPDLKAVIKKENTGKNAQKNSTKDSQKDHITKPSYNLTTDNPKSADLAAALRRNLKRRKANKKC